LRRCVYCFKDELPHFLIILMLNHKQEICSVNFNCKANSTLDQTGNRIYCLTLNVNTILWPLNQLLVQLLTTYRTIFKTI